MESLVKSAALALAVTATLAAASQPVLAQGITWTPDRTFPAFPAATSLDVATVSGGADEHYLFTTLEGLVNRTQPRIFLRPAAQDALWLSRIAVPQTAVADPWTLLVKYATEVHGIVIYDDAQLDTVNLATTIAGIRGGVVASPALAARLTAAPYGFAVLEDLRSHHFASGLDVYRYELANVASQASNRIIVGLRPEISDCLRDYAVATEACVIWLDPTDPVALSLLDGFLSNLASNAPYLGWWTSEPVGVGAASKHGVPTYAADYSQNLSALAGVPANPRQAAAPAPPPLENKAYVALIVSDGDNVQECQNLVVSKWQDPARGTVPISWTVQPGLVDLAPIVLDYFASTASQNDVLVSGPSGEGYTYPALWPTKRFAEYARYSASVMERAGLRVITAWNDGQALAGTVPGSIYAANMPTLLGLTEQLNTGRLSTLLGTLPALSLAQSYGENEQDLVNGIDGQLSAWSGSSPLFVAVQGDNNQAAITPSAFAAVVRHYAGNPNVVFVRADHLFQLVRESQGLPVDPQRPAPPASVLQLDAARDLAHLIGRADEDGWSAACSVDPANGTLAYGPYTRALPGGAYTARFSLLVDDDTADDSAVAVIDVNDSTAQTVIARQVLTRKMFRAPWTYQEFDLDFGAVAGHALELRTFWTGTSYVRETAVLVSQLSGLYLDAATDLAHSIGRQDQDGWSATCGTDTANRALAYGPYTTALGAGGYTATFSLLVDDATANDDLVATLDVNDATDDRVLASLPLHRRDFRAAGAYQTFSLWFQAPDHHALELRTWWTGTSYVRENHVEVRPAASGFVLEAATDLDHRMGRADQGGWSASCGVDQPGHMCYGPYTTAVPAGAHTASFGLMVDDTTADRSVVAVLDVYDPSSGQVLAQRSVTRDQLGSPFRYVDFTLPFTCPANGNRLEFRTWWSGTSYVREDRVVVSP